MGKSFNHVVESLYLRTSEASQMKGCLGKMQVLSEAVEEEVDKASRNADVALKLHHVAAMDEYEVAIIEDS